MINYCNRYFMTVVLKLFGIRDRPLIYDVVADHQWRMQNLAGDRIQYNSKLRIKAQAEGARDNRWMNDSWTKRENHVFYISYGHGWFFSEGHGRIPNTPIATLVSMAKP